MIEPGKSDWQRRRSDFNHQWLKNRLLSALDTADHVIRGRLRGSAYLQELLDVDLPEWQERQKELDMLLEDFETEMSPRRLFDSPPLSACEPRTRELLAELLDELWRARYPVSVWLQGARKAASEVSAHYKLLRDLAPVDSNGRVLPEFAVRFEEFRSACRALSEAIEKLPNRILVT
jgi:hypothetical protein